MIIFDLETTGLDLLKDRIIEIYALKINGSSKSELHYIVNPGIPVSPESTAVHGYTNEMLNDKPCLSEYINNIYEFFLNEDIYGYNILNFDILLLSEEFNRYNIEYDFSQSKVVDLYSLWRNLEPRTLKGALKRFCNEDLIKLHNAKNDVIATNKVMYEMLNKLNINNKSVDELSELSNKDKNSLCYGKILINEEGKKILNFGQYIGYTIEEIYDKDIQYLRWLCKDSNMNTSVKYYIIKEATKIKKQREN